MKESRRVIVNYNNHLRSLTDDARDEYEMAKRNRKSFEELIVEAKDIVYSNEILNMIYNHISNGKEYDWNKIYSIYEGGVQPVRIVKPNTEESDRLIILSYYNSFKIYALLEIEKWSELQKLLSFKVADSTISKLLNVYFINIATLMLSEPHFRYNINSRLSVSIKGKSRKKKRYDYKQKLAPINWGESFKLLQEIASIERPDLLKRYKDKLIPRKDFIAFMKPFVYNEKVNPDGKKWLVRCNDDFGYWVVLTKSSMCTVNEMLYSVVPTNNRHVGKPLDEYIHYDLKTINKVIDNETLGFADKIRALASIDNEYCLNTFYNDLQTN